MKHSLLVFLAGLLCLTACRQDQSFDLRTRGDDCLLGQEPDLRVNTSCNMIAQLADACGYYEVPGEFNFSDEDRDWLPAYCLDFSDQISFKNAEGDRTRITLLNKGYVRQTTGVRGELCADGLDYTSYCVLTESAYVDFTSTVFPQPWRIALDFRFDFKGQALQGASTSIVISEELQNASVGSTFSSSVFFFAEVIKRTSRNFNGPSFSAQMTLLGEKFENVYTYKIDAPGSTTEEQNIQFFYNREYGIVSFVDPEGTQWVLEAI